MYLLAANNTLRTILILLVLWQLLRLWVKVRERRGKGPKQAPRWTGGPARPMGDIRIEKLEETRHSPPPQAEDADFEVIKDKPEN